MTALPTPGELSTRLFFDQEQVFKFGDLLDKFGKRAFASPFRSTVPLLALIKHDWPLLERTLASCGLSTDGSLHFEYQVASPAGVGTPSQTDLMILSPSSAIAVEAKWTEPRYELVEQWLARKEGPGDGHQRKSVDGWLELLRPYGRKPLELSSFSKAVYQTIHRAASACATNRSPSLFYLHFHAGSNSHRRKDHYYQDLANLHHLLGSPEAFAFHLVEIPVEFTSAFERIKNLKKGTRMTNEVVKTLLATDRLFLFGQPEVRSIS